jgi:hypothetical protein
MILRPFLHAQPVAISYLGCDGERIGAFPGANGR